MQTTAQPTVLRRPIHLRSSLRCQGQCRPLRRLSHNSTLQWPRLLEVYQTLHQCRLETPWTQLEHSEMTALFPYQKKELLPNMWLGLKVAGVYFQALTVALLLSWARVQMGRKRVHCHLKIRRESFLVLIAKSIICMRSILNVISFDVRVPELSKKCINKSRIDTGVRPYVCGLCNDTFSRSDILKRHFVKCSSRRGNPTGQNHLEYSRRKKAREQQEAESTENGTPTVADNAQMANLTPTSMDGSFDITALTLNQSNYGDQSNQVSRSNSVTRSNRGAESHSNRVSIGMMTAPGYESGGYAPSTGHATPDSITTSGAATPYHFSHEQRPTQLPESGSFPPSSHADPSIAAFSRAPTSSHFNGTALPHIVGHEYGRGFSMEWPHFPPHNTHDEYGNEQHPSGTNTPLEHNKPDSGYSNIPLPNLSYLSHRS